MACSASASLVISTKPNPLGCPVSRSVTMLTRAQRAHAVSFLNMDRTASSVAVKLRFPTKIFFMVCYLSKMG